MTYPARLVLLSVRVVPDYQELHQQAPHSQLRLDPCPLVDQEHLLGLLVQVDQPLQGLLDRLENLSQERQHSTVERVMSYDRERTEIAIYYGFKNNGY